MDSRLNSPINESNEQDSLLRTQGHWSSDSTGSGDHPRRRSVIEWVRNAVNFRRRNNYSSFYERIEGDNTSSFSSEQSDDSEHKHEIETKYESLDYDPCENDLYIAEECETGYRDYLFKNFARWLVMFIIGIITALIACFIDFTISSLAGIKYRTIKALADSCILNRCMGQPLIVWIALNVAFVSISAFLVAVVEPVAAGSGIPQIKCYLNGVLIPKVVRLKTLFCKVVGVTLSVVGGLAIGKEGPMIHSGSVVAAGISQGRSSTFGKDCHFFKFFRTDHEKRDFVSGGAAAGVAAAFGAPIGGVLFSLEEGASFWNQSLTWRIFFASMVSTFTLNIVQSFIKGHPFFLTYSGLINFGTFGDDAQFHMQELLVYIPMAIFGGLSGALFNKINHDLTVFRAKYLKKWYLKMFEAMIVAATTSLVSFILIYSNQDCQALGKDHTEVPLQMYCGDGEYNSAAALWLRTPEESVKSFFHDQKGSFRIPTVLSFTVVYFFLATWTYGLSVPSGLFIPSLLTGAAWGRLVAILLNMAFPNSSSFDAGKLSLVGAAAQLGGIVRMTISLTVILLEATGNISFGLPLMITLMIAKWVGDLFNEGLYDIHIELAKVPILSWEAPAFTSDRTAESVMTKNVQCINRVEKVSTILDFLNGQPHSGFPVVDDDGTLRGFVLRSQLVVLLKHRMFYKDETDRLSLPELRQDHFRALSPHWKNQKDFLQSLLLSNNERDYLIDLTPFMNPSPYAVSLTASYPRMFKLFRGLGLRHLVVIDTKNKVLGIVTRKDLARYKFITKGFQGRVHQLAFSTTTEEHT